MVLARSDHGYPAGGDAIVIGFEPLEFTLNVRPNRIRWLASLEYDLKGGFSSGPFSYADERRWEPPIHNPSNGCSPNADS